MKNQVSKKQAIEKVEPILNIMYKAEYKALEDKSHIFKKYNLAKPNSINPSINDSSKFSVTKDNQLKIITQRDCFGIYYATIKVPMEYFNMTHNEVMSKHTKWSHNYIDMVIGKKESSLRNDKITVLLK